MTSSKYHQSLGPATPVDPASPAATPAAIGIPVQKAGVRGYPIQYANLIDGLSLAGRDVPKAEQDDAREMERLMGMQMKSMTATAIAMMGYEGGRATSDRMSRRTERKRFSGKRRAIYGANVAGSTIPGASALTAAMQTASGGSL